MQGKRNRKANIELTENDIKVFEVIKQRKKCIIKDLKNETGLPPFYLDKILSILQAHKMVKSIKTLQFKNLNVWVLYDHPQEDNQQPRRKPQVKKTTIKQQKETAKTQKQQQQIAKLKEEPQTEEQLVQKGCTDDIELMNLVKEKTEIAVSALEAQAIHKNISTINLNKILLIMELQADIRLNDGIITSRKTKTIQSPCISCHFRDICHPDSFINPQSCPYLLNW